MPEKDYWYKIKTNTTPQNTDLLLESPTPTSSVKSFMPQSKVMSPMLELTQKN